MMLSQVQQVLKQHFRRKLEGDSLAPGREEERVPFTAKLREETTREAERFVEAIARLPFPRFIAFTAVFAAFATFFLIAPDIGAGPRVGSEPNLSGSLHVAKSISDFLAWLGTHVKIPVFNFQLPALMWDLLAAGIGMVGIIFLVFLLMRMAVHFRYQKLKAKIDELLTERYRVQAEALELRIALGNLEANADLDTKAEEWRALLDLMDDRITKLRDAVEAKQETLRERFSIKSSALRRSLLVEDPAGASPAIHEAQALWRTVIQDEVLESSFQQMFVDGSGVFDLNLPTEKLASQLDSQGALELLSPDQRRELLDATLAYRPIQERVASFVESQTGRREVLLCSRQIPQHGLVETNQTFYGTMLRALDRTGMSSQNRTSLIRRDSEFVGINFINLCLNLNFRQAREAVEQWERD